MDQLQKYLHAKRLEYEYAKANNLKTLMEVTRQAVKKTIKNFKVTLQPGKQHELF